MQRFVDWVLGQFFVSPMWRRGTTQLRRGGENRMKQKDKKVEDFWDGLEVRKPDEDREFKRKVVLGADALVNAVVRGLFRGIMLAILIFIVLYAIQQYRTGGPLGLHNGRIVHDHSENGHFVEDRPSK
jgi:hypothetical protein